MASAGVKSGQQRFSDPARAGIVVAVIYIVVSAVYIVSSDRLVVATVPPDQVSMVQTIKGWCFVVVTGVMLFLLVRHRTRMIERRKRNLLATIHASPLPMYTLDHAGRVQIWSVAAERVLGWTRGDVVGQPDPMHCMHGDDEAMQRMASVKQGQRIVAAEIERLNRNGKHRKYMLCAAQLASDGPNVASDVGEVLVILQDVTDQRRNQQLAMQRRSISRSLDDFDQAVGVIGHELRTPLASMRASTEVLLSEKITNPDEVRELLQIVHDQVNRMNEMAGNMLESARLGSGRAKWNWQTVPLDDICEEAIEILNPLIDNTRVTVSFNVEPRDLTMRSDSDAIRRLILNLATNAAKHTPEGQIDIELRPAQYDGQRWIELTVTDTGFGMDEQTLERIGQAFASNEGAMNESVVRGAGLGLAICSHIVAAHDGRIAVASKPNEGTRVVVRLAADLAGPTDITDPGSIIREVMA